MPLKHGDINRKTISIENKDVIVDLLGKEHSFPYESFYFIYFYFFDAGWLMCCQWCLFGPTPAAVASLQPNGRSPNVAVLRKLGEWGLRNLL